MDDAPAMPSPNDQDHPALERILVTLQKSLSRLSNASRDVPPDQARALITGSVDFDFSARYSMAIEARENEPDNPKDSLRLDQNGPITLRLTGQIESDLRIKDPDESESDGT